MDRHLVEKVTRMVISELEAYSSSISGTEGKPATSQPLSDEELAQWKDISAKLNKSGAPNPSIKDNVPLTDEEISRWNQLSDSIHAERDNNPSDDEAGKVRFSKF